MQRTWVQSLLREDSTCHGATKPVHHCSKVRVLPLLKPVHLGLCSIHSKRSRRAETPAHCKEERPPPYT